MELYIKESDTVLPRRPVITLMSSSSRLCFKSRRHTCFTDFSSDVLADTQVVKTSNLRLYLVLALWLSLVQ